MYLLVKRLRLRSRGVFTTRNLPLHPLWVEFRELFYYTLVGAREFVRAVFFRMTYSAAPV